MPGQPSSYMDSQVNQKWRKIIYLVFETRLSPRLKDSNLCIAGESPLRALPCTAHAGFGWTLKALKVVTRSRFNKVTWNFKVLLLVTSRYCRVLPYFQPNRDNAAFRSIPLVFLFLFFYQLELLQGDLSVPHIVDFTRLWWSASRTIRGPRYGYFETKPTFWSGEKWQYDLGSTPCFDEETRLYVSTLEPVIFDPLKKPTRRLRPWNLLKGNLFNHNRDNVASTFRWYVFIFSTKQ